MKLSNNCIRHPQKETNQVQFVEGLPHTSFCTLCEDEKLFWQAPKEEVVKEMLGAILYQQESFDKILNEQANNLKHAAIFHEEVVPEYKKEILKILSDSVNESYSLSNQLKSLVLEDQTSWLKNYQVISTCQKQKSSMANILKDVHKKYQKSFSRLEVAFQAIIKECELVPDNNFVIKHAEKALRTD